MYFANIKTQKLYIKKRNKFHSRYKKWETFQNKLRNKCNDFDLLSLYKDAYPQYRKLLSNKLEESRFIDYHQALLNADFLLTDGIAIQLSYFLLKLFHKFPFSKKIPYRLKNLNGTDFVPYFLSELQNRFGTHKINLILYGSLPSYQERIKKYFQTQ
ncbi:MAG: hypothetical protein GXP45_04045 [bacterium]|nr:hypothetical protein [bacterium]